jgi:hypothetical protein
MRPVADDWFSLTDPDSGRRIGAWHVVVRGSDAELVVSEKLSVQQGSGTVAYRTEAAYRLKPRLSPRSASVTTYLDGEPYMAGELEFKDGAAELASSLTDGEARPLDPEKETIELPAEGTVLVHQGLPFIAPRVLGDRTEIGELYLIDAPADIDVVAEVSGPYRLVRTDREGGATYALFEQGSDEPLCRWTLDADGRLKAGRYYQTRFERTTKERALAPTDGE